MDSDSFTIVADRLRELSELDRLEARGTIRLAFKKAGVDVACFGLEDLQAIFATIMPEELEIRGCEDTRGICDAIIQSLKGRVPEKATQPRDEIMRRMGDA
jgi:hypothetical protein